MRIRRRTFLAGLAGASVTPVQAQAAPVLPPVVDAAFDLRSPPGLLAEMRRRQVRTVFRYYALRNQPERGLPSKVLTRAEAEALWDHGFSIGVVFQYNNDRIASLSAARGAEDARHALGLAGSTIRQPRGSAIYFGIDGGWASGGELAQVDAYFGAVAEQFAVAGNPYRLGVYGSGTVCARMLDRGMADLAWLALSRCWPGTPAFLNAALPRWSLYQFSHHARFAGQTLDANMVNPRMRDFGAFERNGLAASMPQTDLEGLRNQVHFLTGKSARMLAAPDAASAVIMTLNRSHNPMVLSRRGPWLGISVDGSDRVAGYTPGSELSPTMPAC